jgi:hypothetical protein
VCFIRFIFPEDGSMTPLVRKERVKGAKSGMTQTGKNDTCTALAHAGED